MNREAAKQALSYMLKQVRQQNGATRKRVPDKKKRVSQRPMQTAKRNEAQEEVKVK